MSGKMLTCTWAPTVFAGPQVVSTNPKGEFPDGRALHSAVLPAVQRIEALGLSHLLIAQRWWGSGVEMEGSSLDCLAMTALFAAHTERIRLVTAIHPGFFHPGAIAKWGTTMDWISGGRWDINVTSGWNLTEFDMYGIDTLEHDQRYARSSEFIDVLRGAWDSPLFSYEGNFYRAEELRLEPRPSAPLTVFQGGQSDDAIAMAAARSDWMFLNGGSLTRIESIISRVRKACLDTGRTVRFAIYAAPLVRRTDAEAWAEIETRIAAIDRTRAERRRAAIGGAEGMWASNEDLSLLDTNEGYAARLIGSPDTVYERLDAYRALGIEMLHFSTGDQLFNETILPELVG
ncbi:MAG: LLM class flavin-dependent oxidoreductase [Gammaproteobacteria bacterium]|nr:LLM class flavin-dependent oxidoreductase [Gammaproteobacteria bacterium]MYB38835.1 LLM class flavin-dependent oxidoreductase [Gammaproteobacteria bacterium]